LVPVNGSVPLPLLGVPLDVGPPRLPEEHVPPWAHVDEFANAADENTRTIAATAARTINPFTKHSPLVDMSPVFPRAR
jgi:hypothetical protein